MKKSQALILAAGKGTRLAGLNLCVPKPLVPVRGRPFLEYLLRWLKVCGIHSVVIGVSKYSQVVSNTFKTGKRLGMRIEYSIEDEPRGTAITIFKARRFLQDQFFIVNGDTIFKFDPNDLILGTNGDKSTMTLALLKKSNVSRYGEVIIDHDGLISKFIEKGHSGQGLVYSCIAFTSKKIINGFKNDKSIVSLEHHIFPELILENKLRGVRVKGNFWDIGTPESYKLFNNNYYRYYI